MPNSKSPLFISSELLSSILDKAVTSEQEKEQLMHSVLDYSQSIITATVFSSEDDSLVGIYSIPPLDKGGMECLEEIAQQDFGYTNSVYTTETGPYYIGHWNDYYICFDL